MAEKVIKIAIADTCPVILEGLSSVINSQSDFEINGKLENEKDIINHFKIHRTNVLILDLDFPKFDIIKLIHNLKKNHPEVKIIIFTNNTSEERVISAIKAGVDGYILKKVKVDKIIHAIRAVDNGEPSLHPEIASKLMNKTRAKYEELTKREYQILRLMARGYSNKKIAYELFISERTVKFHISSIFFKLDVSNRTEAVTNALNKGLIDI